MMWLEILDRHGDVVSRQRLPASGALIGRGYAADVMLDDPAVAACHLRIAPDAEGLWHAEDLGSRNGLQHAGRRVNKLLLDGDTELRIGRTTLRLRDGRCAVAPERPPAPTVRHGHLAGLAALGCILFLLLDVWLEQTTRPELPQYVLPLAACGAIVLLWVGLWSLVSRSFGGQAGFERHLLAALAGTLLFFTVDFAWHFFAFAFVLPPLPRLESAFGWSALAALAFVHLRVVGNGRRRLKAAAVALLATAAFGLQEMARQQAERNSGRTAENVSLLPPAVRLAGGRDPAAFFAAIGTLRAPLDHLRHEDRPDDAGEDAAD